MQTEANQSATRSINNSDNRLNSRNSISRLEEQREQSRFNAAANRAKAAKHKAIAAYQNSGAEQEKITGQNQVDAGRTKKMIGFGMMAAGIGMMFIPGAGPAIGLGMMANGAAQVGAGISEESQGNKALQRAAAKLEEAVKNGILSKQEAKVAHKEMQRSNFFQRKIDSFNEIKEVLQPKLQEAGISAEDLTEDGLKQWYDKLLEDAAKTLANGGILEEDFTGPDGEALFNDQNGGDINGNSYFIRGEDNEFYQIEVARDEDGNAELGAFGEPLLFTEDEFERVDDPQLKAYLDLKFSFVDELVDLASQSGYITADDDGNIEYNAYDFNNLEHMNDLLNLVQDTNFGDIESGKTAAPLKFFTEGGVEYFQEWDWEKDVPIGPRIPVDDIYGGDYEKDNVDSYAAALDRSDNALRVLGLNVGGRIFNEIAINDESGLQEIEDQTSNSRIRNVGRDSPLFDQFRNSV